MKWAKTEAQLGTNSQNGDPVINSLNQTIRDRCIEEYTSINNVKGQRKRGVIKSKPVLKTKSQSKTKPVSDTFEEWITYPLNKKNQSTFYPQKFFPYLYKPLPKLDQEGRRRYEIFCGGFLHYHDVIVKKYHIKDLYLKHYGGNNNKVFEHKIYFEWFDQKGNILTQQSKGQPEKVTIYITETPPALNPNPPDPPGPPPPY
ncbi:MAG TPA: hypothetical protein VJU78_15490 [Chitinophagaceae bacterium]|nr:hypothetical protein [Chitinophagaceae bacterium]